VLEFQVTGTTQVQDCISVRLEYSNHPSLNLFTVVSRMWLKSEEVTYGKHLLKRQSPHTTLGMLFRALLQLKFS